MSKQAVGVSLLVAIFIGAVGRSYIRGDFEGIPADQASLIIGGVVLFCIVYFGAIHLLLKGWDRLWASLKRRIR